jgi:hypothetical protein
VIASPYLSLRVSLERFVVIIVPKELPPLLSIIKYNIPKNASDGVLMPKSSITKNSYSTNF